MARIRTIKPEIWTDEKFVALSPLARLLFIGLLNFVDDEGRAAYSPARFKMQILPADPADVSALLGEIRREGMIQVYPIDGKEYLQVCNFSKHQKVDKRVPSKLPAPPTSPDFPRNVPADQGRDQGSRNGNAAPDGAQVVSIKTDEADLFDRGKKILGPKAGGLITELLKAKGRNIALARAALETASTKSDAREYIGAIIRGADPPERTVDPRL